MAMVTANYISAGQTRLMLAVAELLLTPRLNATAALNAVTVFWPAGLVNFNLQASTNLADWSSWIHAVVNTNGPVSYTHLL